MFYLTSITLAVLGALCLYLAYKVGDLQRELRRLEKEMDADEECIIQAGGLEELNQMRQDLKEKRKSKILEFLEENKKITSGKVADILDVSRMTAYRYLIELAEEGELTQKGAGGFTRYKKSL